MAKNGFLRPEEIHTFARQLCRPADVFIIEEIIMATRDSENDLNKNNGVSDNYSFTLLREEATDIDSFEDKTHEKIAETLYNLIKNEKGGLTIGLEGSWGSGKSVVISILRKKLKLDESKIPFFTFDAWAHEGDPLRRIFLESLIGDVFQHKNKTIEDLQAEIAKRIKHRKITTTRSATGLGVLLVITTLLVPLGIAFMNKVKAEELVFEFGGKPYWLFWASLSLILAPIWVVVGRFVCLWHKRHKKYIKKIFVSENWSFMQGTSTENVAQEVSEDEERSSIEFESYFQKIITLLFDNNPDMKLVMVIDNLDRVDVQDSLKLWSTLQTFLQQRNNQSNNKDWFEKIWIIVPYDPVGLAKLWDKNEEKEEPIPKPTFYENRKNNNLSDHYFDKCFQLKFEVPKPILTAWEQFAEDKIEEAFVKWDIDERKKVLDILKLTRKTLTDIPTPRQIKNYINQVGLLKMHSNKEIQTESIAYYVVQRILERNTVDEIREKLLLNLLPENCIYPLLPESCCCDIAGLIFGVSPITGQQMLLEPYIQKALATADGKKLKELQEQHSNGFWGVLALHIRDKVVSFEVLLPYSKAIHDGLWKEFKGRLGTFSKRAKIILYQNKEFKWPNEDYLVNYHCLSVVLGNSDDYVYLHKRIIYSLDTEIAANNQFDMPKALKTLDQLNKIFKIDTQFRFSSLTLDKFVQWVQASADLGITAWKWIVPNGSLADQISGKILVGNANPPWLQNTFVYLFNANSSENWSSLVAACHRHIAHNNGNGNSNTHSKEIFEILFILAFGFDAYNEEIKAIITDWRSHNIAWTLNRSITPSVALLCGKYYGNQINNIPTNPNQPNAANFVNNLKIYWHNSDKDNANALFVLLKKYNKWDFLWNLAEDSNNKLVADIIILALKDNKAVKLLFKTNDGLRKIKICFSLLGNDKSESVDLIVEALIKHSPLEEEIIKNTEIDIIQSSRELFYIVSSSSNSQLIASLAEKVKIQSKERWNDTLRNNTYLIPLAIAIKEEDSGFYLDNDYADAFIDFVKDVSKGTAKLSDWQKGSWQEIVSLMESSFQIQYKSDLTEFVMDEHDKVSNEFIEFNGEYFDYDKMLQKADTVQNMLRDALSTKNIARLKWLNELVLSSSVGKKFKPQPHFPELVTKQFNDLLKQEQGNKDNTKLIEELASKFQVELEKPTK